MTATANSLKFSFSIFSAAGIQIEYPPEFHNQISEPNDTDIGSDRRYFLSIPERTSGIPGLCRSRPNRK